MLQTKEREGNASVLWCKKSFLPSSFCVTVWYDRSGADIAEEMKTNWFAAAYNCSSVSPLHLYLRTCSYLFLSANSFHISQGKEVFFKKTWSFAKGQCGRKKV